MQLVASHKQHQHYAAQYMLPAEHYPRVLYLEYDCIVQAIQPRKAKQHHIQLSKAIVYAVFAFLVVYRARYNGFDQKNELHYQALNAVNYTAFLLDDQPVFLCCSAQKTATKTALMRTYNKISHVQDRATHTL